MPLTFFFTLKKVNFETLILVTSKLSPAKLVQKDTRFKMFWENMFNTVAKCVKFKN